MSEMDYLEVYDFKLTTAAPLHIGSGKLITKKDYVFDSGRGCAYIFDQEKFFQLLIERNLVDRYESFMLGREQDLYRFLKYDCRLNEAEWKKAVRYSVNTVSALDRYHSLKDIHTFMRDAYGRAYVPGSSLKGALKTVLLCHFLLNDSGRGKEDANKLHYMDDTLDKRYLNTLKLNKKRQGDMVNSIMRGLQISDSAPITDESMTLSMKMDSGVDGVVKKLNVCRECVKPDTEINFKLTLDRSILKGRITKELLLEAIDEFDAYYWNTYMTHFAVPEHEAEVYYDNSLVLGGGSGFFAKSLVYPYLGEEEGLRKTSELMQKSFRKHKHDADIEIGISPHTLKYTEYDRELYPMGLCKVEIV